MGNSDTRGCNNLLSRCSNVSWYDCLDFYNKPEPNGGMTPITIDERKICHLRGQFPLHVRHKVTTNELADGFPVAHRSPVGSLPRGDSTRAKFIHAGSDSVNQVMWYAVNSGECVRTVGTTVTQRPGLYIMSSNVLEWSQDFNSTL